MKRNIVTLLTNAQIKDIYPDYLKTILKSRMETLSFLGEPVNISLKYKMGKTQHLIFRLGAVKINTVDELVKTTMHHLENVDKNLRYEKLYLLFSHTKR